jgi:cytoskeletal protein RodZ
MRIAGWSFGKPEARLAVLPAIAIAGCTIWLMIPQASDAESHSAATPPEVSRLSQDASRADDTAATQATLSGTAPSSAAPADANPATAAAPVDIAPAETTVPGSPLDGLKIVSQSWRRGGLGSKAMVTFTLHNANEYAVKDVEIACTFTRRDGSHLTDRRRIIPDTVNMKSRKRYAGVLVGFINVNANKAKCSLVTASRI